MIVRLTFPRFFAFLVLSLAGTWLAAVPGYAQSPAPSPYAPPPGSYVPGYYPPPGSAPPGYPPPGYYAPPAEPAPRPDPPATATHLGVGYKIGNGLGVIGGDVIISPIPHVVADLQVSSLSIGTGSGTATGFGFAPALQYHFRQPGVSTPYLAAGYIYARLSLDNVVASASGMFINAGYEWKWSFGMGILVGGGICYLGEIKATDGVRTINENAQLIPMLEASIRFMFL